VLLIYQGGTADFTSADAVFRHGAITCHGLLGSHWLLPLQEIHDRWKGQQDAAQRRRSTHHAISHTMTATVLTPESAPDL
jgi:hypothetical protein